MHAQNDRVSGGGSAVHHHRRGVRATGGEPVLQVAVDGAASGGLGTTA